ncbi:Dolichyl-phosphate-mannose--protein mannosyltransferase 1 [Microbotryomycetes sp. JL201]|nr:Dolichyl-phosphate-mannose--protein mannosyltransferase 1 [Microbotryomycetes sp. JL201]
MEPLRSRAVKATPSSEGSGALDASAGPLRRRDWRTNGGTHDKPSRYDGTPTKHTSYWTRLGGGLNLSTGETRVVAGLTVLAAVVRLWKIGRPSSVVFDEVHFGGFANKYIQSRFFMDVHPPLAKLLITLMAYLSGFEGGSFDFKDIGREYGPEHVPYIAMRLLPATLGLLLVPMTYLTLRALQTRPTSALAGALLIMFDNSFVTQSRFILLDSPLVFFTALSALCWICFTNENDAARDRSGQSGPFSRPWWTWLVLTGLSLGAVVSCKWVGLFTIATVGLLTVHQLWTLLGDLRVPLPLLARHFAARAVCLIAVPSLFYLSMFAIHFAILSNSGDGDGFMSSEFQHTLRGHGMEDTYLDVMVGSHVTIKHAHTQGGYLHSHPHNYPAGSKQQQITLYPHRDDNNVWVILNATANSDIPDPESSTPPTPVQQHAIVVLRHLTTDKKLHSHDVRAPVTEVDYQNEVSAYGFEGFEGDANDHFQLEIDRVETDVMSGKDSLQNVQTLRTRFRLRHVLTGCYLFSHKVKLPDWGFEQQEVTCNKNPSRENAIWYIETNTHKALPDNAAKVNYRRPGFLSKFLELQRVMWRTNAGLTDRHAYDSRPQSWPILRRGINFWVKDHRQVYLIGNPFVWWSSTLAVFFYAAVRILLVLRAQRGYSDFSNTQVSTYDRLCGVLALGWALHYFPFFLMGRQLFLHHYLPALYFAILLLAVVFDLATSRLRPRLRLQVVIVLTIFVFWSFWHFSPLTYAGEWTRGQCERAKWGRHWDFSCNDFPEKLSDYAATIPVAHNAEVSGTGTAKLDAAEPGRLAFGEDMAKAAASSSVPAADDLNDGGLDDMAEAGETESVDSRQVLDNDGAVAVPAVAEGTATRDLAGAEDDEINDALQ